MLLLLAVLAAPADAAPADGPSRVGPRTGDYPILDGPVGGESVTIEVVRRPNHGNRFGPLPVRRSFAAEMTASLAELAAMNLAPDLPAR